MRKFIAQNRVFLSLYLLFLISGAIVIVLFEKGDDILYINSLHTPFFNSFFKWVTRLAEFPALMLFIFAVFFSGYGRGVLLSFNSLAVFATVQLLKQIVFAGEVRPSVFFESRTTLDYIPGIEILHYNSFPSGHTAIAFGLFFMLSVFSKNNLWAAALFFAALLVGVSRVYLLQHFFRDVYFGSVIGVFMTIVIMLFLSESEFYKKLKWKDKKLLK